MSYKHKLIVANASITDPIFSGKMVLIINDDEEGTKGVIVNAKPIGLIGFGEFKRDDDEEPDSAAIMKKMAENGPQQTAPLFYGGPVKFPGIYFMHGYSESANLNFEDLFDENKSEFDLGIPSSFNVSDDMSYRDESFSGDDDNAFDKNQPMAGPVGMSNMTVMDGLYFGNPAVFCSILKSRNEDPSRNKWKFFSGHAAWAPDQLQDEIDEGAWTVIEDVDPSEIFFDDAEVIRLVKANSKKNFTKVNNFTKTDSNFSEWTPFKGFDPKRN